MQVTITINLDKCEPYFEEEATLEVILALLDDNGADYTWEDDSE